jgi:hypothetical protein
MMEKESQFDVLFHSYFTSYVTLICLFCVAEHEDEAIE